MVDFTKPPTKEQLDAWPPLTLEDVFEIEEKRSEQLEHVIRGDMGKARTAALTHAHEIAAMWPRTVTTAMLLWHLQKHGPRIATRCPSCGGETLFIGTGGHLTCSVIGCRQPSVEHCVAELYNERSQLERELNQTREKLLEARRST